MKKTIIIDAQLFQTPAWHRGMGKYSYELVSAFSKKYRTEYRIIFIFNSNLKLSAEARAAIDKISYESENVFYLDLHLAARGAGQKVAMSQNQLILTEFINSRFDKDTLFLVLSPFSDELAPALPSIGTNNFVIVYDLIPFMFYERYMARIDYKNYLSRFRLLFDASMVFSISETVKSDLISLLGVSSRNITNINGAYISHGKARGNSRPRAVRRGVKYILMPTGDELRKNNRRAVRAFEMFRGTVDDDVKLVTTSFYSETTKEELGLISDAIVFTGNVKGEELAWLYRNAQCLLFPSEYEGLGLPVLEGVKENLPIACSSIGVFLEMSDKAFHYFAPEDIKSMCSALGYAYGQGKALTESQIAEYSSIMREYTWENSADELVNGLHSAQAERPQDRPKIAVICPATDGYSAIGKIVAETHYEMSQYFDVDYYYDEGPNHHFMRPDYLSYVANSFSITSFLANKQEYRDVIYHMGNSEYHMKTILLALKNPEYIILHDTNLTGLYTNLKQYAVINKDRLRAEQALSKVFKVRNSKCLVSLVSSQKGILVHSDYAKKAVQEITDRVTGDVVVNKANLPTSVTASCPNSLGGGVIKVGVAGILADVKGLNILEEMANSPRFDNCEFHLFGLVTGELTKRLHNMPSVILNQNPSDYDFQKLLSNLDILVNYRDKYNGETSLTVVEAMAKGVAVIVRDIGWYSELPMDAVAKVKSKEDVHEVLAELVADNVKLESLKNKALKFAALNNSRNNYAKNIQGLFNEGESS